MIDATTDQQPKETIKRLEALPPHQQTLEHKLAAAYLAGVVDVRGWIYAEQRRSAGMRPVRLFISASHREPLEYCQAIMGAGVIAQAGRLFKLYVTRGYHISRILAVIAPYAQSQSQLIAAATKLLILQTSYMQYRQQRAEGEKGAQARLVEVEAAMLATEAELDAIKRSGSDRPFLHNGRAAADKAKEQKRVEQASNPSV